MTWTHYPATELLTSFAVTWQQVSEQNMDAHPLIDLDIVAPLLAHFGHPGLRLAVETRHGDVVSMALVQRERFGIWNLFLPSQAQIAPAMLIGESSGGRNGTRPDLAGLMAALPGFVLLLGLPKQDPAYSGVTDFASDSVEVIQNLITVGIRVDGTFEDYWKGRSHDLKKRIARNLRHLERDGLEPRLLTLTDPAQMANGVADHGDLESAGWKAQAGTAIHRDNVQGRFYTDVLQRFAAKGGARAYQLYFGDRLVASQLAIGTNGMMVLLKTAHDEVQRRISPGRMLDYFMLRALFADPDLRVRVIEYYTNATQEDLRWATFSRQIVHVNFFRNVFARRLCQMLRWTRQQSA